MSAQDIQNLYKIINDLREKVSVHIGQSSAEHKTFQKHIEKDEEWKDSMEKQVNLIATEIIKEHSREEGETERKKKLAEHWKWAIVVGATLMANNLPKFLEGLAKMFSLLVR